MEYTREKQFLFAFLMSNIHASELAGHSMFQFISNIDIDDWTNKVNIIFPS